VSEHAATAVDQLAVADCLAETREQQFTHSLEAAKVHALLAIANQLQSARGDVDFADLWTGYDNRR